MSGVWQWSSKALVVNQRVLQGAYKGMTDATNELLQLANDLVPVDTGALRDSGVASVEADDFAVHGAVSYGTTGTTDIEAIEQHERLDFAHAVGQAKYLEQPFYANADRLQEVLATGTRDALEGGEL